MKTHNDLSRRGFLEAILSTSAFVLSIRLAPQNLWAIDAQSSSPLDETVLHPSVYLGLAPDGTVHIIAHRSEMGTTSRTSLPLVLAEELDADWNHVKVHQAIGDARYGPQDTDGSHSIREFYEPMREAGATARLMLVRAAAQQWAVPEGECSTEPHVVIHQPTGKKVGYGELAGAAAKLPIPNKGELTFKPESAWRYIGKGHACCDLQDICTGRAQYGMDVRIEGMMYASIEHPPVLGGKVKSFDAKAPLEVKGVSRTIVIETFTPPHHFQPLGGIAVIADNTWSAMKGRTKLKPVWDLGTHQVYNSDQYKMELQESARRPGKAARNQGDVDAAFAQASKVIEAEYYVPHLAHASMEPPVALAEYRDGKVTLWASTQNPQAVQETVSQKLGVPKEAVTCHVPLLGGGFGRKSKPDYCAEAAILSKAVGRPVKVVWSREDDIRFDYYHTVSAMYMKAALGSSGLPSAWLQRSVFPSIGSTFDVNSTAAGPGELQQGWMDVPFDIPNLRVENSGAPAHLRIGWLRSVANIYHAFAAQSFADECAHATGRDPVEYLLGLIGPARIVDIKRFAPDYPNYDGSLESYPIDTGRYRNVIQLAADKSSWGKLKLGKGQGMGIAVHRSFLTYVATVVQVEVTPQGEVHIPRVDTAVDAGLVVNPEATRSQFEGAAVFATSLARFGEITATNGVVDQSNFDTYRVSRMNEAPYQTNVHIVKSSAPPAGVGEPGVPPFAPALCNAIFAATGKRVRELPLSRANLGT